MSSFCLGAGILWLFTKINSAVELLGFATNPEGCAKKLRDVPSEITILIGITGFTKVIAMIDF